MKTRFHSFDPKKDPTKCGNCINDGKNIHKRSSHGANHRFLKWNVFDLGRINDAKVSSSHFVTLSIQTVDICYACYSAIGNYSESQCLFSIPIKGEGTC